MATKSEMQRARCNAYKKGYKIGEVNDDSLILNPYLSFAESNTHNAFLAGYNDARNNSEYCETRVIDNFYIVLNNQINYSNEVS